MGFKRYVAATTREAMRMVRQELGEDAVILASKRIAGGHFELLAAASEAVDAIVEETRVPRSASGTRLAPRKPAGGVETFQDYLRRQPQPRADTIVPTPVRTQQRSVTLGAAAMYEDVAAASGVERDPAAAAASWWDDSAESNTRPATRINGASAPVSTATRAAARSAAAPASIGRAFAEPAVFRRRPTREFLDEHAEQPAEPTRAPITSTGAARPAALAAAAPAPAAPAVAMAAAPAEPVAAPMAAAIPLVPAPAAPPAPVKLTDIQVPQSAAAEANHQLMAELHSLRAALQEQLTALSTSVAAGDTRRNPLVTRLMTRMLSAGFSVDVARRVAQHAPADLDLAAAPEWLQSVIALNLKCADSSAVLIDRPGVFALLGPTGVGKTTTVAKLAARFAVKYGTSALGIITLDAYRVAAHEQLRTYGRILGTPVHLAQDGATLRELLASMRGKRLVLIDTCGVGPRDERLNEMLGMLAEAGRDAQRVQPVLLLNAGSHTETLDETARAWRASQAAGAILTKLDEAARIGGALDCALRYKLTLLGLSNGQRVPEDLHLPNAKLLAHLALKPGTPAFALTESEAAALAAAGAS